MKSNLLWDFPIQTDNQLNHNRPGIVIVNKARRSCLLIDIACPFDTRIEKKEKEKIDVYLTPTVALLTSVDG